MNARTLSAVITLLSLVACEKEAPSPPVVEPGERLPGFTVTAEEGRRQRAERERKAHHVSLDLPELRFSQFRSTMLGDDDVVLAPPVLQAREGQRVRVRGYALPLVETRDAVRFVLQRIPYVGGTIEVFPPPNGQILVILRADHSFDYTDAPLVVEGNFHLGVFPSFAADEPALFALEDALVEELPPDSMTIPLFVDMPEDYRPRSDLELFPGDLAPPAPGGP